MGEVKLVSFNNGLQVLGTYEKKDEEGKAVLLSKPVQLVMVPKNAETKDGQVGMAFAPFLQYAEEWTTGVTFSVADVLTVTTPVRDLLNAYNSAFGSGIVLPGGSPDGLKLVQ
jgi:hypothetical protein